MAPSKESSALLSKFGSYSFPGAWFAVSFEDTLHGTFSKMASPKPRSLTNKGLKSVLVITLVPWKKVLIHPRQILTKDARPKSGAHRNVTLSITDPKNKLLM